MATKATKQHVATKAKVPTPTATSAPTRSYVKQSDIPRIGLAQALRVAQAMYDAFAGKSAAPHQLAIALDLSPTSKWWDALSGAAQAYGLIDGASKAEQMTMTDLARRIVAPTQEGDDLKAMGEAVLRPRITREFLERYDRAKFPPEKIGLNVLVEMGVPQDRAQEVLNLITENGKMAGIIQQVKTGLFVAISNPVAQLADSDEEIADLATHGDVGDITPPPPSNGAKSPIAPPQVENNRVFITHGKNKQIVTQLKDLLTFGKFIPVVAEEHETPSKPVPDKVLADMRSCFAGIIHVASEETLLDGTGSERHLINENVLIEIGAAMALYGGNFILLVQQGLHLPSNLQGLYKCYYEGDKLDYDSTMKLLKAFNGFSAPGGLVSE